MELRQMVSTYVDELEAPTNAWGQSIHPLTMAALRDRFGQSETDSAIDAECAKRRQLENKPNKYATVQGNVRRAIGKPVPHKQSKTRLEIVLECIAEFAPDGILRTEN